MYPLKRGHLLFYVYYSEAGRLADTKRKEHKAIHLPFSLSSLNIKTTNGCGVSVLIIQIVLFLEKLQYYSLEKHPAMLQNQTAPRALRLVLGKSGQRLRLLKFVAPSITDTGIRFNTLFKIVIGFQLLMSLTHFVP